MKILFLGDSITQGIGASAEQFNYVNRVKNALGCEVINYGVSGTRIARQTHMFFSPMSNYDFRLRAVIMDEDADLVFVFGGTNDYGHGICHLGDIRSRNEDTFVGNLRLLIEYMTEKYGKDKLCFLLPLRRSDEDPVACKGVTNNELGASLEEYVCAMRAILTEYGIDFIDLYENGIPKPLARAADEYTADGVHPNDKGHALVADKILAYIREKHPNLR